jgi:HEAT repeat protein
VPDPAAQEQARQQAEAERRASVQQWAAQFVDLQQTEAARLQALGRLRGAGPGARGGAVATAAIALVQTSQNAETRAEVWRQMNGAKEAALVPQLLASLQTDPDARVRKEAAEALGDYVDQPEVQAALRVASTSDADQTVRRQAEQSLARVSRDRR